MTTLIGLYGGSFNPIHNGHLMVAREVLRDCGLDRIVFLPAAKPPHKSGEGLVDAGHRLRMVELAIRGEPRFELSRHDASRSGPTYTIETINHFQDLHGAETSLCWIIGADSLKELATWHRAAELVDLCRVVTAGRPGSNTIDWTRLGETFSDEQLQRLKSDIRDTPQMDIASTDIRRRIARGEPIDDLVPPAVRQYIETHKLYTGP